MPDKSAASSSGTKRAEQPVQDLGDALTDPSIDMMAQKLWR
jgi:hypothetical protein